MNIKDYLHLYLGCEVSVPITHQRKFIISGVQGGWTGTKIPIVSVEDKDKTWTFDCTEIKLILRQLSDMTEDEYKEAGKYGLGGATKAEYWLDQFEQFEERPAFGQGKKSEVEKPTLIKNKVRGGIQLRHYTFAPGAFLFLLSKGFDLFGLIDAGLAIDKAKLKTLKQQKV